MVTKIMNHQTKIKVEVINLYTNHYYYFYDLEERATSIESLLLEEAFNLTGNGS